MTATHAAERDALFDQAREHTPYLAVSGATARYVVSTADGSIGRDLFARPDGGQAAILRAVVSLLRSFGRSRRLLRRPMLDAGADVGSMAIPALIEHGIPEAIACEPVPDRLKLLRVNIAANMLQSRVTTRAGVLSDKDGHLRVAVDKEDSSAWRAGSLKEMQTPEASDEAVHRVERFAADGLLHDVLGHARVGLVRIRQPGHELQAVAGAEETLSAGAALLLQLGPRALEGQAELEGRIASHGRAFAIAEDTTDEVDPAAALRTAQGERVNLLVVPA